MPASAATTSTLPIPASAGVGLRRIHEHEFVAGAPPVGWLEVHSENYFAAGGGALAALDAIRERYPISLHGVGLSLGSADPLDRQHLQALHDLVRRVRPGLVSEHLSWGAVDGRHSNDLLPLPCTEEALNHFVARLVQACDLLGREILIENVSSYLRFAHSTLSETEFLLAAAQRSGCRLLLDVNNLYVNACNHGFDAEACIDRIPPALIAEIHLAGHSVNRAGNREVLIDTHGAPVAAPVWSLYRRLIARIGPRPTLIEWDTDVPPLPVLLRQAQLADAVLGGMHARVA